MNFLVIAFCVSLLGSLQQATGTLRAACACTTVCFLLLLPQQAVVTMDRHREKRISQLLGELRSPTDQHTQRLTTQSSADPGTSWRDADRVDGLAQAQEIESTVEQDREGNKSKKLGVN